MSSVYLIDTRMTSIISYRINDMTIKTFFLFGWQNLAPKNRPKIALLRAGGTSSTTSTTKVRMVHSFHFSQTHTLFVHFAEVFIYSI